MCPSEITLPVAYENSDGRPRNPDFKGPGSLTIRTTARAYVFSGARRAVFSRKPVECEFRPDEIWNVSVAGPAVSFHTKRGTAGEQGRPFVFCCASASDAQTVAALLPTTIDQDFVAVRDFSVRLHSLRGAENPWTSATNIIIALNILVYIAMGFLGAGWFQAKSLMP